MTLKIKPVKINQGEFMKKYLSILCMFLLAIASGFAASVDLTMESLAPAGTSVFMRSAAISDVVSSYNRFVESSMNKQQREELSKKIADVKAKTGLDPFNEESLKKAGIDTKRPMGFAYMGKENRDEKMMILLPVSDADRFSGVFSEMQKKMDSEKQDDVYPVVTSYRNFRISQSGKDVFTTVVKDYFIITSTGNLIREVVDRSIQGGASLAADSFYLDYTQKHKSSNDINFYFRGHFISGMVESLQKTMFPQHEGMNSGESDQPADNGDNGQPDSEGYNEGGDDTSRVEPQNYRFNPAGRARLIQVQMRDMKPQESKESGIDAIDYSILGVNLEARRFTVQLAVSFNDKSPMVNSMLDLIRTGATAKALSAANSLIYVFLSLDLAGLEKISAQDPSFRAGYEKMKQDTAEDFGIDLQKDFIPYSHGVFNVIAGDITKNEFALFVPMKDGAMSEALGKKIQAHIINKYAADKRSGYENITGGVRAAYYFNDRGAKTYFFADRRGLYTGSGVSVLKAALKSPLMDKPGAADGLAKRTTANSFFLAMVKKNLFVSSMLQSQMKGNKALGDATRSLGDIYLTAEKTGRFVSLDLDVAVELAKQK
jgi:hypothetical protein